MGSPASEEGRFAREGPQRKVDINCRFAIGRYPVTFDDYDLFCAEGRGERPEDEGWGRGRRPVINVSWDDAQSYVNWLRDKTGQVYRLPSEAEWEYACRAGTMTRFSFGDRIGRRNANFNSGRTNEVGFHGEEKNPWGLYDMHGNVWEWVEDDYDHYDVAPNDGSARKNDLYGPGRRVCVLRGGSWNDDSVYCRSAFRGWNTSDHRWKNMGFRIARTIRNP